MEQPAAHSKLVLNDPVTGPDGIPVSITVGRTTDSDLDGGDPSGIFTVIVLIIQAATWVMVKAGLLKPWTVAIHVSKPHRLRRVERYPSEQAAAEAAAAFTEAVAVDGVAAVRALPRPT